jgi:hypothetical protein
MDFLDADSTFAKAEADKYAESLATDFTDFTDFLVTKRRKKHEEKLDADLHRLTPGYVEELRRGKLIFLPQRTQRI